MKNIRKNRISAEKAIFFIFTFLTIVTTYFITDNCIDSDASSELVLANHLAEVGKLLSSDWFYSTELRVINTQLIFALLFKIFDNWHFVRFLGAIILQAILILSYLIFTKLLKMNIKIFYLSASLFLLPISVCYGRIVLYHSYYIPHLAISLLIVGLTFTEYNSKKLKSFLKLLFLIILSFIGGLGGVRHLLFTHAPILLCVLIYFVIDDFIIKTENYDSIKKHFKILSIAIVSLLFYFVGFYINDSYLSERYNYADYGEDITNFLDPKYIDDVLYGFFHHFGFRKEIKLMSLLGILSALGIFLGVIVIILAFSGLKKYIKHKNIQSTIPFSFLISYVTVMLFIFLVIGNGYYFVLYLTPLVIWSIPIFVIQIYSIPKNISVFNLKRILPFVAIFILFLNGIVNSLFLINSNHFTQKYEGLTFSNINIKGQILPAVDFLNEENYELGYATFWNGNVVTEISNGKIKMIGLEINSNSGSVKYHDWLTLNSNRTLENKKDFLLLESNLQTIFEKNNNTENLSIVYQDDFYIIYDIK